MPLGLSLSILLARLMYVPKCSWKATHMEHCRSHVCGRGALWFPVLKSAHHTPCLARKHLWQQPRVLPESRVLVPRHYDDESFVWLVLPKKEEAKRVKKYIKNVKKGRGRKKRKNNEKKR